MSAAEETELMEAFRVADADFAAERSKSPAEVRALYIKKAGRRQVVTAVEFSLFGAEEIMALAWSDYQRVNTVIDLLMIPALKTNIV